MNPLPLDVDPEVRSALEAGQPVVALESTLIAHGLPWPTNLETAQAAEKAVRAVGATPATIAIWNGRIRVGLDEERLHALATTGGILKATRRDLAHAIVTGRTAATTVAATMTIAEAAGIRVFATGGIGGVHRGAHETWDVSADLTELARTPVAVVCAGAKSILDLPRTLEVLETLGVPVVGYRTRLFPAFYVAHCNLPLQVALDSEEDIAALLNTHWCLKGGGVIIAQQPPAEFALAAEEFADALERAGAAAVRADIRGPALTPFLLRQLAEWSGGRTLRVNQALIVANAALAARIAVAYQRCCQVRE